MRGEGEASIAGALGSGCGSPRSQERRRGEDGSGFSSDTSARSLEVILKGSDASCRRAGAIFGNGRGERADRPPEE